MSLVIDMKTRVVLHNSEDDADKAAKDKAALPTVPSACDLRLATLETDRLNVWQKWVPGLLPSDEDSDPETDD